MCDTLIATPDATAGGTTLFAKNSDREPNEAHHVTIVPGRAHPPGSTVACTYLTIPQAGRTFTVFLAKPFWIWGAEMGANEHGVVIGNEAVFTKVPYVKKNALTGMDLLRLALERSSTAREALEVITELIAAHGQGGNCGFRKRFFYHNSFIIADPHDAWLLETAGRFWAALRMTGVYAISNGLTIGSHWDLASPDLVSHAIERGWCRNTREFHFARCYSDTLFTFFSDCRTRRGRTNSLLSSKKGSLTVSDMAAILRDHGEEKEHTWRPHRGLTGAAVCMHAGFGPIRASQTTGSMISSIRKDTATHFVTGTAAPCTGIFKPVWLDTPLPETGPVPSGIHDGASLFWKHEVLHRKTLCNHPVLTERYRSERDRLEASFVDAALRNEAMPATERAAISARCFAEAEDALERWISNQKETKFTDHGGWLYRSAWRKFNRDAGMPPE